MKRTLAFLLAAALLSLQAQGAILEDSKHNFTDNKGDDNWYTGSNPCSPCHYPDISEEEKKNPQWDVEYNETVLPAMNTDILDNSSDELGMMTRICISCHDGTIAHEELDSVVNNYHVGRWYDQGIASRSDGAIVSPSSMSLPLYNGKMDCPTCHDPHSSFKDMLRIDNNQSRLCHECHNL